jgi:glutamate N-acetyltransferase/amino-acid N-acetyltransferase
MSYTIFEDGHISSPTDFRATGVSCGLKGGSKQRDLALVYSLKPCRVAAMFTSSLTKAAPVFLDQAILSRNRETVRAVLINAGQANAGTGQTGLADAVECAKLVADELEVQRDAVLVMSTGVIGVPLPMHRVRDGIKRAVSELDSGGGRRAAVAILTNDSKPKERVYRVQLREGRRITLAGMAKGTRMVHPRLGTLLCLVTTDLAIEQRLLARSLQQSVDRSFNRITIDGDQSPNDTVLVLANGAADGVPISDATSWEYGVWQEALDALLADLSQQIVRDAAGSGKIIQLRCATPLMKRLLAAWPNASLRLRLCAQRSLATSRSGARCCRLSELAGSSYGQNCSNCVLATYRYCTRVRRAPTMSRRYSSCLTARKLNVSSICIRVWRRPRCGHVHGTMIKIIEQLPLFPLGTVLFPGAQLNLHIFEERYRLMIGRCLAEKQPFGVVLLRSGDEVEEGRTPGAPAVPCEIGTLAYIDNSVHLDDGRFLLSAVGRERFRVRTVIDRAPYLVATVELLDEVAGEGLDAAVAQLRSTYESYWQAVARATGSDIEIEKLPDDAIALTYDLADRLQVTMPRKQVWLEGSAASRARSIAQVLRAELSLLPRPDLDGDGGSSYSLN